MSDSDEFVDASEEVFADASEALAGAADDSSEKPFTPVVLRETPATHSLRPAAPASTLAEAMALSGFSRVLIFTDAGLLATNMSNVANDWRALLSAFDDRTQTVGNGINLAGTLYNVHRFYDNLIYGRAGHDSDSVGFGLARFPLPGVIPVCMVFVLVTFEYPMTSARAIPRLYDWSRDVVIPLAGRA